MHPWKKDIKLNKMNESIRVTIGLSRPVYKLILLSKYWPNRAINYISTDQIFTCNFSSHRYQVTITLILRLIGHHELFVLN